MPLDPSPRAFAVTGPITEQSEVALSDWQVEDVLHLRQIGTRKLYLLPPAPNPGDATLPFGSWLVGTSSDCFLRLEDPTGQLSRIHARLSWDLHGWRLDDLASKNGMLCDGVRQATVSIAPGMRLRLGGVQLIAESRRIVALREYLSRLLGWSMERRIAVDEALFRVRRAMLLREPIWLRGDGDLVPIALDLHRTLFDPDRPFVLCTAQHHPDARARGAFVIDHAEVALRVARKGSLCVRAHEQPAGGLRISEHIQARRAPVQVFVCGGELPTLLADAGAGIQIPNLQSRPTEVRAIVTEFLEDASSALGLRRPEVRGLARDWILAHAAESIGHIATACYRLVALAMSGSIAGAAWCRPKDSASLGSWQPGIPSLPTPLLNDQHAK